MPLNAVLVSLKLVGGYAVRAVLGIIVLVIGVLVLGWWGANNNVVTMENQITQSATEVVEGTTHPVDVSVSGRDIRVSGLVDSDAEKAALVDDLDDIDGRRVVLDDLRVLPTASPYVFQSVVTGDGQSFAGNTPTDGARASFAARIGDAPSQELVLAAGMPDANWTGVVGNGLDALGALKRGELLISDRDVTLTGLAALPENEAAALDALASLPDGYTVSTDIELEDDGTPMRLSMALANGGATAQGKVPAGVDPSQLLSYVGSDVDAAGVEIAKIAGPTPEWAGFASTGVAALGRLDAGDLTVSGTDMMLSGIATRAERTAAEAALSAIGEPYTVTSDISLLDDGKPFSLNAKFDGNAVVSSGKVPFDVDAGLANTALGVAGRSNVNVAEIADPDGAWTARADQALLALADLKAGELQIEDTDVRLTGSATRAGKAAAEAKIAGIAGATSDITIFDDGEPFALNVDFDGSSATGGGKLPFGMTGADVNGALGVDVAADYALAEIESPDGSFQAASAAGLNALSKLQSGTLSLVDQDLRLTGTALTPDNGAQISAMLNNLPAGYDVATEYDYIDDGTPPAFNVDFTADNGARLSGKLPAGLTAPDIAQALNLTSIQSTATEGLVGVPEVASDALQKLSGWMPELESATFVSRANDVELDAVAAPGVDIELLTEGLSADFPQAVEVTEVVDLPDVGTERVNALTGVAERFSGTAWTPVFDFNPNLEACQRQSIDILAANKVNFVTGQARLDAKSVRAVNALAGLIRHCISTGELWAEVGGHTDSVGGADGNQRLSQARASAVQSALLDRGIPADRLAAVGYGEERPIASNDTDEGRAANRRTEITWSGTAPVQPETEGE